jgi:uncharacterized protein YuzE
MNKIQYHFDPEGDVLYACVDRNLPAIYEDGKGGNEGIEIRVDGNRKVGFLIINYLRKIRDGRLDKMKIIIDGQIIRCGDLPYGAEELERISKI